MTSTTLQQYLNAAWAENKVDHVLRAVSIERGDGSGTEFYIRPQNGDGETLQLVVSGNRIMLPVLADKTLIEDFENFLAYSNLSASAELLVAYAEGRGTSITLMDAIIAVDPLMSATHAGLAAHQQEQANEGAPIATITAPPLDGRVPATARSAELRATDEYIPPADGLGYELHAPSLDVRDVEVSVLMGFGGALKHLKSGARVMRKSWDGQGMWVRLLNPYLDKFFGVVEHSVPGCTFNAGTLMPWIGLKTTDGKFVPWQATQFDMLAEDWTVLDTPATVSLARTLIVKPARVDTGGEVPCGVLFRSDDSQGFILSDKVLDQILTKCRNVARSGDQLIVDVRPRDASLIGQPAIDTGPHVPAD